MCAQFTTSQTAQPPINFAVQTKLTLADLLHTLSITKAAAEAACTALSECEERHRRADGNLASVAKPKVCGGLTKPMSLTVGDVLTTYEPSEWFFRDREQVKNEGTPEQLAEWDLQAKAAASAYPKDLRKAVRAQLQALDKWTAAERAVAAYKPTSLAEVSELLTLASQPQKPGSVFLDLDQYGLESIIKNCAKALHEALAN